MQNILNIKFTIVNLINAKDDICKIYLIFNPSCQSMIIHPEVFTLRKQSNLPSFSLDT